MACYIVICVWHAVLSVPFGQIVTCWEKADLLARLRVMFSCVFVPFPYVVMGQVWLLIVSIPDRCLLPYFYQGLRLSRFNVLTELYNKLCCKCCSVRPYLKSSTNDSLHINKYCYKAFSEFLCYTYIPHVYYK